jgi:2-polyprenyl-3-methyl-5-hydroxy-6-metoxy-1,4-benzoquinol methylase
MENYHKYVFDTERRTFVGHFEEMYQNESIANFDSWHQEDTRQLNRQISLEIIDQFNFGNIVDVGCGKGALTHRLKKKNNKVLGIDISHTAIDIASARFPDIAFKQLDVGKPAHFSDEVKNEFGGG